MKKLLTVSIIALTAFSAVAQNGLQTMRENERNAIIHNVNPQPPVMVGNQVLYPAGGAAYIKQGRSYMCNTALTINNENSGDRVTCNDQKQVNNEAAGLAKLAPAAGPAALTDRNLPSDGTSGLRADKNYRVQ